MRIALKKPFSDGTVAVDMDPISLLLRLCAAVPAPRFHTIRYAGVFAARSKLRSQIVPRKDEDHDPSAKADDADHAAPKKASRYWAWAKLMARSFQVDVEKCPTCGGRMKLVTLVQETNNVERFLRHLGEPTDVAPRAPARDPPYFRSPVIRRLTSGDTFARFGFVPPASIRS